MTKSPNSVIHDYLTNRRQWVRLADQLSKWKEVSAEVPQGSVLGILFICRKSRLDDTPHTIICRSHDGLSANGKEDNIASKDDLD